MRGTTNPGISYLYALTLSLIWTHFAGSASHLGLHLEIDSEWDSTTLKEIISILPLWSFHLHAATFQRPLYMEYIHLSWYEIPGFVVPLMISLIEGSANKEASVLWSFFFWPLCCLFKRLSNTNPTKTGVDLRFCWRVRSSCPTNDTRPVTRKGSNGDYDKGNISVVICDTDIL
jgi:hypothetical protein